MPNLTAIDWCGYRTQIPFDDAVDLALGVFEETPAAHATDSGRGWMGYSRRFDLTYFGKSVGFACTGGESMRGWSQINLTGSAMPHLAADDTEVLPELVRASRGQLKRVDIALTVRDGSLSCGRVKQAYEAGGFSCGGRRPKMKEIVPDDPTDGATIYIGKRDQPKFVRAYDKGYELARSLGLRERAHGMGDGKPFYAIDGIPAKDIFRIELEVKAHPDVFDDDVLESPDCAFAGSYPYLSTLVAAEPQPFQLTPQRQAEYRVNAALNNIRRQYGATLYTALRVHQGDIGAVWDKIVGDRECEALLLDGARLPGVAL